MEKNNNNTNTVLYRSFNGIPLLWANRRSETHIYQRVQLQDLGETKQTIEFGILCDHKEYSDYYVTIESISMHDGCSFPGFNLDLPLKYVKDFIDTLVSMEMMWRRFYQYIKKSTFRNSMRTQINNSRYWFTDEWKLSVSLIKKKSAWHVLITGKNGQRLSMSISDLSHMILALSACDEAITTDRNDFFNDYC